MEVKGAEVEKRVKKQACLRGHMLGEMLHYRLCEAERRRALRGLKSSQEQQTDLQAAEDQQAALHQVIVLSFRETRDDRKSLMYCTIQSEYSSHRPHSSGQKLKFNQFLASSCSLSIS